MAESDVQDRILQWLKHNPKTSVVKVVSATTTGVADILVCHYGRFIAIEVKDDNKKAVPDPHQAMWLNSVIKAGGQAICTNNLEDVIKVLRGCRYGKTLFELPSKVKFEDIL